MEKFLYIFSYILLIIININFTFNLKPKGKPVHPINIYFDFSNLPKNDNSNYLIKILEQAKSIISKLVLSNNIRNLTINETIMSKFKEKYLFVEKTNITNDLIILPAVIKFTKKNLNKTFMVEILSEFGSRRIQPSIAILNINNKTTNFEEIFNDKNKKYILLMESLRALTDCLGLSLDFIKRKKQPRNNFFETPLYLISNSLSFNSIKKLYNLTGKPIPDNNIAINGQFYISYWDKNSIVQDFRNEIIDLKSDISEVSMNLLNDMDYYKVIECDFHLFINNICYRIDQECLNKNELETFYLNYGINTDKENEIICYLSNSNNLNNNQCGIKYGHLVNENLDFCPLIRKLNIINKKVRKYEIPELIQYKNQTLKLLKSSDKCKNFPRTIYFQSEYSKELDNGTFQIDTITLNETERKYFVTYLTTDEIYFDHNVKILKNNGLIRSYFHNDNNNLLIKPINEAYFKKNKYINKYQKIFHFIGNTIFFNKDLLYTNYLFMKSYFPKTYNYMPKTYIYPKHKEKIEKIFKNYKLDINNLWIVKPIDLFSGKGIHLFKSLKEENMSNFIISKYLNKPHLIKGRKYDLRLYILVTGFSPLRIYLNKEGLVRISANKYTLNKESLEDKFIHLTNTAINKESKKYIYPKNINDEKANKWNLNTYRKYLKEQNIDYNLIFEQIKDIVIKTIISGQKKLVNITSELTITDRNMFNIFGFDVLIDRNLNASLLEVNTRPFMFVYDRMDKVIKTNLFVDTLNIVGLTPFSHERKFKTLDKEILYKNKVRENVDNAFCELTRPRGDFELIFPLKENIEKYKKLFFKKVGEENRIFWKEILKSK